MVDPPEQYRSIQVAPQEQWREPSAHRSQRQRSKFPGDSESQENSVLEVVSSCEDADGFDRDELPNRSRHCPPHTHRQIPRSSARLTHPASLECLAVYPRIIPRREPSRCRVMRVNLSERSLGNRRLFRWKTGRIVAPRFGSRNDWDDAKNNNFGRENRWKT